MCSTDNEIYTDPNLLKVLHFKFNNNKKEYSLIKNQILNTVTNFIYLFFFYHQ